MLEGCDFIALIFVVHLSIMMFFYHKLLELAGKDVGAGTLVLI